MEGFVQKKAPVVAEDYEGMSFETARVIRDAVKEDPELLLSLAAGSSAIRTYEILGEMQARGEVDFSRVRFVQLDEWLDLKDRSEDCASFLRKHFFGPLGIREEQIKAVVSRVQRKGKTIGPGKYTWHFFRTTWLALIPLRPTLQKLYTKIRIRNR